MATVTTMNAATAADGQSSRSMQASPPIEAASVLVHVAAGSRVPCSCIQGRPKRHLAMGALDKNEGLRGAQQPIVYLEPKWLR